MPLTNPICRIFVIVYFTQNKDSVFSLTFFFYHDSVFSVSILTVWFIFSAITLIYIQLSYSFCSFFLLCLRTALLLMNATASISSLLSFSMTSTLLARKGWTWCWSSKWVCVGYCGGMSLSAGWFICSLTEATYLHKSSARNTSQPPAWSWF